MNDTALTILIALLGSSGLFTIIQFLLNRHFNKRDKINEVNQLLFTLRERIHLSELSDSRTQLLILINHYHDNHYAILKEAENYFCTLKGDSWMIEILTKWAEEENVDIKEFEKARYEEQITTMQTGKSDEEKMKK